MPINSINSVANNVSFKGNEQAQETKPEQTPKQVENGKNKLILGAIGAGILGLTAVLIGKHVLSAKEAQKGAEAVKGGVEEGAQKLKEGAQEAAEEGAQKLKEGAQEAVEEGAQKLKEGAQEAVEEGTQKLKEDAQEAAEEGAQKLEQSIEEETQKGQQVTGEALETTQDVVEKVTKKPSELISEFFSEYPEEKNNTEEEIITALDNLPSNIQEKLNVVDYKQAATVTKKQDGAYIKDYINRLDGDLETWNSMTHEKKAKAISDFRTVYDNELKAARLSSINQLNNLPEETVNALTTAQIQTILKTTRTDTPQIIQLIQDHSTPESLLEFNKTYQNKEFLTNLFVIDLGSPLNVLSGAFDKEAQEAIKKGDFSMFEKYCPNGAWWNAE